MKIRERPDDVWAAYERLLVGASVGSRHVEVGASGRIHLLEKGAGPPLALLPGGVEVRLDLENLPQPGATYLAHVLEANEVFDEAGGEALTRDPWNLFEYWKASGDETLVAPSSISRGRPEAVIQTRDAHRDDKRNLEGRVSGMSCGRERALAEPGDGRTRDFG